MTVAVMLLWGGWLFFSGTAPWIGGGLVLCGSVAMSELAMARRSPNRLDPAEVAEILEARGDSLPDVVRLKLGVAPRSPAERQA